jgi:hypothetical protein
MEWYDLVMCDFSHDYKTFSLIWLWYYSYMISNHER